MGCRLKIHSDSIFLEEANERIERLTIQVSKKPEERDYTIEMPKLDIEEIKKALKLADEYTMETIIKYLKIDNYELIKNLAKTINKTNFAETSIYMDGALGRNEAMIKVLSQSIKDKTFINRVT